MSIHNIRSSRVYLLSAWIHLLHTTKRDLQCKTRTHHHSLESIKLNNKDLEHLRSIHVKYEEHNFVKTNLCIYVPLVKDDDDDVY